MVLHGLADVLPEDATKRVITVLLVAGLVAIALFRVSGAIWPLYALGVLGVVHVYAAASSRSAAAIRGAALAVMVVLVWGVGEVTNWSSSHEQFGTLRIVEGSARFQERVEPHLRNVAIGVWALFVLHALRFSARSSDEDGDERRATGLSLVAIVLGSWGLWAWLVANDEVSDRMLSVTVLTLLTLSCLTVVVMTLRFPPSAPSAGALPYIAAVWLTVLTPIVYSAEFVTGMVQKALGQAMPRLLGKTPLHKVEVGWLETVSDLRAPIATVAAVLTAVMIVASALSQVVRGESTVLKAAKERIDSRMQHARARIERLSTSGLGALVSPLMKVGYGITFVLVLTAYFMALLTFQIIVNVYHLIIDVPDHVVRLVRYFVLPLLAASALSFAVIAFTLDLEEYVRTGASVSERAVWGEGVIVLLLVIALYLPATGFAGSLQSLVDSVSRVAVAGLMVYLIFSLTAAALTPMVALALDRFGLRTSMLGFGPLYRANTIAVVGLVMVIVVIIVTWLLAGGDGSSSDLTGDDPVGKGMILVVVALGITFTIFSALAIRRGYEPMVDAMIGAFQG